jgi:hypothetical protein
MSVTLFGPPPSSGRNDTWISAGLASSYPDVTSSGTTQLSELLFSESSPDAQRACKVFCTAKSEGGKVLEIDVDALDGEDEDEGMMKDQVLVFRYKGTFYAVNNVRPLNLLPFLCHDCNVLSPSSVLMPPTRSHTAHRSISRTLDWSSPLRSLVSSTAGRSTSVQAVQTAAGIACRCGRLSFEPRRAARAGAGKTRKFG